uniref:Exonuclease domain-containing protein n=1 Tax=Crocodylus porosus TaxID=8502 RepID=A0A7M4FFT1_CROPO
MVEPSGIVALDCEMVGVGPFGAQSRSAHCSTVDYYSNVLYDRFIRPEGMMTDCSTFVSRVCPSDVQGILWILRNKWVVGHNLHHDFEVLKQNLGRRLGRNFKHVSLKVLWERILKKRIQKTVYSRDSLQTQQRVGTRRGCLLSPLDSGEMKTELKRLASDITRGPSRSQEANPQVLRPGPAPAPHEPPFPLASVETVNLQAENRQPVKIKIAGAFRTGSASRSNRCDLKMNRHVCQSLSSSAPGAASV